MSQAGLRLVTALLLVSGASGCQTYVNEIAGGPDPVASCESQATDECERFACSSEAWFDEECADFAGCCFCDCWSDGHQSYDYLRPDECICVPTGSQGETCDEETRQFIAECRRDEALCRKQLTEAVGLLCSME